MSPEHVSADGHDPTRGQPLAALWRTRSYLRPYLGRLIVMLVAACAAVAAQTAIPLLTESVINGAVRHGNRRLLVLLGVAAIGLGVMQAVLSFVRRWVQARAVTGMERAMRDDLYGHLQRLHVGFHDQWQTGQLLSRATTDLSAIRRFAGFGTVFFITNVVTFAAVIMLLVRLDLLLGLLTCLVLLPVVAVSTWFERGYRVLSRRAQDQQGDLATYVEEAATGIGVLKALGRRDQAAARHAGQARAVYRTQVSKARLRGTFWAVLDLVPNAVIGLLLLLGAIAASRHQLTLGGLVAFITLTLQLVWPIEVTGYILASGQEAATAAQRIYEILDSEPALSGPVAPATTAPATAPAPATTAPATAPAPSATAPGRPQRTWPARPAPAGLAFDRVVFRYPGTRRDVLRGVCLELEPGQTLALTGATGAGKTTLLHLVPRLADPSSGRVLLNGSDIRHLPLPLLRARVGCAFEDATLFSASVRENVTFGAPDASEAEIARAITVAQAGFAHDLPWGLDTRIGEQGMALSGGQRQRVALARAILARPPLLVLDDPLSALDVGTEERVTQALRQVLTGTTALVVAHRPSTVLLADKVALMDDGVITAVGTHADLLASRPGYRDLMTGAGPQAADGQRQPGSGRGAAR